MKKRPSYATFAYLAHFEADVQAWPESVCPNSVAGMMLMLGLWDIASPHDDVADQVSWCYGGWSVYCVMDSGTFDRTFIIIKRCNK